MIASFYFRASAAAKRTRLDDIPSHCLSPPREAPGAVSEATGSTQTFESRFLESQPEEAIVAPAEGSITGKVVTSAIVAAEDRDEGGVRGEGHSDDFKGIN